MREEDLELLITLDEPWDGHEDTFDHLQTENTTRAGQVSCFQQGGDPDQRTEVIVGNDSSKVAG